jgi:hypothetical protein
MIDRNNRCCQDGLMLERRYQTQYWSIRVNHSLLGIDIVDSWLLYKALVAHYGRRSSKRSTKPSLSSSLTTTLILSASVRAQAVACPVS